MPGVPRRLTGQLVRFGIVGVLSTLAYLVVFLALRSVAPAQVANLAALLLTAVANTATNRRLTFGIIGRSGVIKHHLGGLAAFGIGLLLTSGALALLHLVEPNPTRVVEVSVLVVANAIATLVRFVALRRLMDRPVVRAGDAVSAEP
jgi:putative flippase GtrA